MIHTLLWRKYVIPSLVIYSYLNWKGEKQNLNMTVLDKLLTRNIGSHLWIISLRSYTGVLVIWLIVLLWNKTLIKSLVLSIRRRLLSLGGKLIVFFIYIALRNLILKRSGRWLLILYYRVSISNVSIQNYYSFIRVIL